MVHSVSNAQVLNRSPTRLGSHFSASTPTAACGTRPGGGEDWRAYWRATCKERRSTRPRRFALLRGNRRKSPVLPSESEQARASAKRRQMRGMGDTGLEPVTSCVSCMRASQLRQSPDRAEYTPRSGGRLDGSPENTEGNGNAEVAGSAHRLAAGAPAGEAVRCPKGAGLADQGKHAPQRKARRPRGRRA